jgi:hypothetical protein
MEHVLDEVSTIDRFLLSKVCFVFNYKLVVEITTVYATWLIHTRFHKGIYICVSFYSNGYHSSVAIKLNKCNFEKGVRINSSCSSSLLFDKLLCVFSVYTV